MLLPGTYRLRFATEGYAAVERQVTVPEQGAARLDVVLPALEGEGPSFDTAAVGTPGSACVTPRSSGSLASF